MDFAWLGLDAEHCSLSWQKSYSCIIPSFALGFAKPQRTIIILVSSSSTITGWVSAAGLLEMLLEMELNAFVQWLFGDSQPLALNHARHTLLALHFIPLHATSERD